jgi:hypothetical protein
VVSGTDAHTGFSSGSEEDNFWGKFPASEPGADRWNQVYKKEEKYLRKDWTLGAAGLTGVWATANTREALWDAMKRREVYASSGPVSPCAFLAVTSSPTRIPPPMWLTLATPGACPWARICPER